ncbi:DUF1697 domain-containing protein [Dyella tabacisoli]|uniref:DUF1697 domain-containing protein n=1 Tax=Dyella tabacisoli TaxID=2282381 RepID=UPI0013B3FD75|nr:DUF1697 domain-containing protein [Dyella tabacisoli]
MSAYIALLRAVNVGSGRAVPMAQLRAMATDMGYAQPRTLLQSGNLVFEAKAGKAATIERALEVELRRRFGFDIPCIMRSATEWTSIVAGNPFARETAENPAQVLVMALKAAPDAAGIAALHESYAGPESIHVEGRQAYLVYPEGIGRSRLTMALLERKLGVTGTARNWNTVLKLAAMV